MCVINSEHGMEGFTRVRATIGGEISAAVGPLGGGSQVDSEVLRKPAPVWTYTKSKGLYLGVQVDGTVIVERTSENERFYHVEKVRSQQILTGQVQPPGGAVVELVSPRGLRMGPSADRVGSGRHCRLAKVHRMISASCRHLARRATTMSRGRTRRASGSMTSLLTRTSGWTRTCNAFVCSAEDLDTYTI